MEAGDSDALAAVSILPRTVGSYVHMLDEAKAQVRALTHR